MPKPTIEASTEISKPRRRNFGVRRRDMGGKVGGGHGRRRQYWQVCAGPAPETFPNSPPRYPSPVADSVIRIVNARQHNLQGITVELPHRALTVITGPSGSGKSSLAFDTLYAEGQRRYIESLSTYAKQFLERMPKPRWTASRASPRRWPSSSGTRPSRAGPPSARPPRSTTISGCSGPGSAGAGAAPAAVRSGGTRPQSAADEIVAGVRRRVQIAFPLPPIARLAHAAVVENLRALGFVRIVADGAAHHLDELPAGSTSPGPRSCWWWWTGSPPTRARWAG